MVARSGGGSTHPVDGAGVADGLSDGVAAGVDGVLDACAEWGARLDGEGLALGVGVGPIGLAPAPVHPTASSTTPRSSTFDGRSSRLTSRTLYRMIANGMMRRDRIV